MRPSSASILTVFLAGCISAPITPEGWETRRGNEVSCAALSGTFSGFGQSVSASSPVGHGSQLGQASLNGVLKVGAGPADAVHIEASPGVLELISIYEATGYRGHRTLRESDGEFECHDGVARIALDQSGRILGRALETYGEVTRLLLSRSVDGALLIEEETYGGGAVLLVLPVVVYQRKLYRFPIAEVLTLPHRQAPTGAGDSKQN